MSWYSLIKYLHVLLAITAVGSNITYGVWKTLGAREPAHAPFALKGIAFIDRRVANPAYGGLLITGLILLAVGQVGFRGWVIAALILFVILIVVAVGFYSRIVRQQIEVVDKEGVTSAAYKRLDSQAMLYGIVSLLIALAIVFVMVVKPFP
jgi:Predicted integral membrane protein (DUF2269)